MSFDTVRRVVEKTLADNWTATPIQFDNVPFTPPQAGWVSVSIIAGLSYPETLGVSGKDRFHGFASFKVFVPRNSGSSLAYQRADALGSLFRRKTINDVTFGAYTARRVNPPFEEFFCVVVDIPFWMIA